jgi:hypothetical protein
MDVAALLLDLYGRVPPLASDAVGGLTTEQLTRAPASGTNPIGWLIWHIARLQDLEMSHRLGLDQLWVGGDWAGRFGLKPEPYNMGYGHAPADVAAVRPESADTVLEYLAAVQEERTVAFVSRVTPASLAEVIDRNWNPPVTLGVRLISIANDSLQHVGQASYVRGLLGL